MTTRRQCLAAGAALPPLAWMKAVRAQTAEPVVIGWLDPGSTDVQVSNLLPAFNEGMGAHGWQLNTHYVVEARFAEGRAARLPALAQEIAARRAAVIVVNTATAARAAIAAAPTTPIVMANGNPLAQGLVSNLARPGRLLTGMSNVVDDVDLKVLELLAQAMPRLQRVGFLTSPNNPAYGALLTGIRRAAAGLRIEAVVAEAARPELIEPAMAQLSAAKVQAVVVGSVSWFPTYHGAMVQAARARRWPICGNTPTIPTLGGLFSFGPDRAALARRSAYHVDRILKGTKPADLPIEQPTAFELVINMKSAAAMGLTVPPSMQLRATRLIE